MGSVVRVEVVNAFYDSVFQGSGEQERVLVVRENYARVRQPVDPGNLLVMGHLGTRPVIGLPGCARSPALNGADWVLERIGCGLVVTDDDIAGMGVGGLLKEMPMRPQPREPR